MLYKYREMFGFRRAPMLPLDEKQPLLPKNTPIKEPSPTLHMWRVMQIAGGIICLVGLARAFGEATNKSCDGVNHGYHCNPSISHFWGQYSMWYSVPSEIQLAIPKGCDVTFANVLSRHGARDPTMGKHMAYALLISEIQSSNKTFPGKFAFLKNYSYTMGIDELTVAGKQELINSGVNFFRRYSDLVKNNKPFVRAGGQDRVVESAEKWLDGIAQSQKTDPAKVDVIIYECSTCNNTLSHDTCPALNNGPDGHLGSKARGIWSSHFVPPIRTRVNCALGTNLSTSSIINLMDMCPFDTVAHKSAQISKFCHLFTEKEWHEYDYLQSLDKYYGYGNGNPLGPTQGVGYVNELIARLTGKPVKDNTNTNRTLDSDPKTFPLDRKVYADFSHDNDISGVLAALGLYNNTKPLSKTHVESAGHAYGFSASWTVPFGSRMYVEKLQCDKEEEFVRIIVNDRVMPMDFCNADKYGRCKLSKFVESQSFSRGGGLWEQCYTS